MIRNIFYLVAICHSLYLSGSAFGDVPPQSRTALNESATAIIVGRISNLEIKEEPGDDGFVDLAMYYTVDIAAVEKGRLHQPGDQIVVRAWRCKERNRHQPGSIGHRPLPPVGEEVRVFLRGTNVEFPNGFAPAIPLDTVTDQQFRKLQNAIQDTDEYQELLVDINEQTPPTVTYEIWIAGLITLIVAICLVFYVFRNRHHEP